MNYEWRKIFRDSFGNHPKFSWFIMSHEFFRHAVNGDYAIIYDAMRAYNNEIDRFDDELAWHYHHADWYDLDGDGDSSWNQLTTFDGTEYTHGTDIEIAEKMLNYLIFVCDFFPCSFRSGWCWENNRLSNWLNDIIPFDYSAFPPNKSTKSAREPLRNRNDWSRAPRTFSGYHPDIRDYQTPGRMRRWIFRTTTINDDHQWKKIYLAARDVDNQILCLTAHSYDNMKEDIGKWLSRIIHIGDSLNIPFRFATASEAGAMMAGQEELYSPEIKLEINDNRLIITSSSDIFQPSPYCVAKDSNGAYFRFHPIQSSPIKWNFDMSGLNWNEIVCGVCSQAGRPATARRKIER
jgi:hypothetical protein